MRYARYVYTSVCICPVLFIRMMHLRHTYIFHSIFTMIYHIYILNSRVPQNGRALNGYVYTAAIRVNIIYRFIWHIADLRILPNDVCISIYKQSA